MRDFLLTSFLILCIVCLINNDDDDDETGMLVPVRVRK